MSVQTMEVEATGFKPFRKNTLRGFVDLALPAVGLVLLGCTLHEKNGSRWIGLPARPYQNDQNQICWAQIIDHTSKEARQAFQRAALAAVEELEKVGAEAGANGF